MICLGALRLPIAACIEFLAIQKDLERDNLKRTKETVDDNHTNWSGPDVFQQLQQMRSSKAEKTALKTISRSYPTFDTFWYCSLPVELSKVYSGLLKALKQIINVDEVSSFTEAKVVRGSTIFNCPTFAFPSQNIDGTEERVAAFLCIFVYVPRKLACPGYRSPAKKWWGRQAFPFKRWSLFR